MSATSLDPTFPAIPNSSPGTRSRLVGDFLFCCGLMLLIWTAYAPSLKHAPRADQWCFLVDTIHDHTFFDTLKHSYSYNRTRTIAAGDTDLFRPILFGLLAAEKAVFGADLAAHQLFGIALHGMVCMLLLGLLRTIGRYANPSSTDNPKPVSPWDSLQILPQALTLFFALNPAVLELVIWSHLNGYLLFLALLLASLQFLLRYLLSHRAGSWKSLSFWAAWALTLLSAFTYELGQLDAVLIAGFLLIALRGRVTVWRRLGLSSLFLAILLLYQTTDYLDRQAHLGQYTPEDNRQRMQAEALTPATLRHAVRFVAFTSVQPFFPSLLQISYSGGRVQVGETLFTVEGRSLIRHGFGPLAVVALGVFLALIGFGVLSLIRLVRRRPPWIYFWLLLLAIEGTYAAVTVLGRMNLRPGPAILSSNCYYAYVGLLFTLIVLWTTWQSMETGGSGRERLRWAMIVGLVALSLHGGEQTRQMNVEVAQSLTNIAKPIRAIHQFVQRHADEAELTISIDYRESERIIPVYGVPVTDVMFSRWLRAEGAKYRLAYRENKLWVHADGVWQPVQESLHGP